MLRVVRHPQGPRVYVVGLRLHHGVGGSAAAALALRVGRRDIALIFALWALTDWRDFPFTDRCNH